MGCVLLLDGGQRTLGARACGHPAAEDQLCKSSGAMLLGACPVVNRVHVEKGGGGRGEILKFKLLLLQNV